MTTLNRQSLFPIQGQLLCFMISTERVPEKHIFVCVNQREGEKTCCNKVKGTDIFLKLKQEVLSRGLNVWVTKTGCMGFCNDVGATVAIYPDKKLYTQVREEDIPKILECL